MISCNHCHKANPPEFTFCLECGEKLANVQCSRCGAPNSSDFAFCSECGTRLGSHRRRRSLISLAAIAVLGGGAAIGYQGLQSQQLPLDTTTVTSNQPVIAGDETVGPPSLEVTLGAPDPNDGLVLQDDEGRAFVYSGGAWALFEPDGSSFTVSGTPVGHFVDRDSETVFEYDPEAAGLQEWAEATLTSMPGVARENGEWTVAYRELMLQTSLDDAVLVPSDHGVELFKLDTGRYLYIERADDHAWVIDDDEALLVVENSGRATVAGTVTRVGDNFVFDYRSQASEVVRAQARSVLQEGLIDELSTQMEIPEAATGRATLLGGTAPGNVKFFFSCGWCETAIDKGIVNPSKKVGGYVGDKAEDGARWTKKKGEQGLDALHTGYVYAKDGTVTAAKATGEFLVDTGEGILRVVDFLGEHGCPSSDHTLSWWKEVLVTGSPGPGKGSDGSGRADFPKSGYNVGPTEVEVLGLARLWMPTVQLSRDEKCGEIVRVMAKVFAYQANGELIRQPPYLSRAALVEIVYTLIFRYDGGRFCNLPGLLLGNPLLMPDLSNVKVPFLSKSPCGFHPGDNEGFSIALRASTSGSGRCGLTGFELVGGRTAAHTGGSVKTDLRTVDVQGYPCPPVASGLRGSNDDPYRIWVSESKHATFWNEAACDRELMSSEECEGGRATYNLASRLELWEEDPHGSCPYPALEPTREGYPPPDYWRNGGEDTYLYHEDQWKAYVCLVRGKPGPQPDNYRLDIVVPDVTGLTPEEAKARLISVGLLADDWMSSVELPTGSDQAGLIVSHAPQPGDTVPLSTSISLSIGHERVASPTTSDSQPAPSNNHAPVAVDDHRSLEYEDTGNLISIDVIGNDKDPDGDSLRISQVICEQGCEWLDHASWFEDGWIEIVVNRSDYEESYLKIVFEYTVTDGEKTDQATVTIEVFYA